MTLNLMIKPVQTYRWQAVSVQTHVLICIPKCASTSLSTLGNPCNSATNSWDSPTIAFIREPLKRWVAGYLMDLLDLARFSDGLFQWRPPTYCQTGIHTTQQIHFTHHDTHLINFESINEYAERIKQTVPHLHETPGWVQPFKHQTYDWLNQNKTFKRQLREYLDCDYQLRDRCQSVQSLPENLFIR